LSLEKEYFQITVIVGLELPNFEKIFPFFMA
jgi:hypothetical protein